MSNDKIRVGIIGAGGWAKYGHIPALHTAEAFEISAVSSRNQKRQIKRPLNSIFRT